MSAVPASGPLLVLHPGDPVAVARRALVAGESLPRGLVARGPVPRGHKVALVDLAARATVRKYGQPIGIATAPIAAGEHVHDHNLVSLSRRGAGAEAMPAIAQPAAPPAPAIAPAPPGPVPTFMGIRRASGRAGTRNYVAVLSTVNCSATVVRRIAAAFALPGALEDHPGVDGVLALTHATGCGLRHDGEGLALLQRTLRGYAEHPNVGAVLVVGLGCEVNQIAGLIDELQLPDSVPLRHLAIQATGGTRATIDAGVAAVRELLALAGAVTRTPVAVSELVLGLNCGGSDAWSGVSANPVLGVAVDRLVAYGATAVLAETPEIHGAEHLLTARAASPAVAQALAERVAWWERYAGADGGSLDNNPSPGNRAGGVTTIEEKSLGAVAKGGSSPLQAVYRYAERVTAPGLVFMDTPGYDPVSVTGIVAGGATVVAFTTGRGSVFGSKPAPSLKLASTRELYERMPDDMDVDCGPVLDGSASVAALGEALCEQIVRVASGELTKSEALGLGDEEFAPWQLGATL